MHILIQRVWMKKQEKKKMFSTQFVVQIQGTSSFGFRFHLFSRKSDLAKYGIGIDLYFKFLVNLKSKLEIFHSYFFFRICNIQYSSGHFLFFR